MFNIAPAIIKAAQQFGIIIKETINIDNKAKMQFLISAGLSSIYCNRLHFTSTVKLF